MFTRFRAILTSSHLRSIAQIASGSVAANLITAAAIPLLTRLYTAEEFGLLNTFAALISILSVAAALRFDIALLLPEDDETAANLTVLALLSSAVVAALLAAGACVLHVVEPAFVDVAIKSNLWLLPVGVFCASLFNIFSSVAVREKIFGAAAQAKVAQSASCSGSQLYFGFAGGHANGLLPGPALAPAVNVALIANALRRRRRLSAYFRGTRQSLKQAFLSYARYPLHSTAEALLNTASLYVPILLISALAGLKQAGHLSLALYAIQAPMALLGTAIGQVYTANAVRQAEQSALAQYTLDTLKTLCKVGAGPLLFIACIAPACAPLVLGPKWDRSGVLVAWLTPWFVLQFLATPLSMALHITGRTKLAMALQAAGLAIRTLPLVLFWVFASERIIEAFAVSGAIFYLAYLVCIARAIDVPFARFVAAARESRGTALKWALAGLLIAAGSKLYQ